MEKQNSDITEIQIENHIRKIITDEILKNNPHLEMLENKDVFDIIICDNSTTLKLFFIEIKHYSTKNNRMGFGNRYDDGFQPEILSKRPKYFEKYLLWVFQSENDTNYYIMTNDDCKKFFMGGSIGKKQNNFQKSLFDNLKPLSENEFLHYIENWITSKK